MTVAGRGLPHALAAGSLNAVIRIALLEDNPGDASLIRDMLWDFGTTFQVTRFERLKEALDCLTRNEFDVILSDLELPDAKHMEAPRRLRAAAPSTPLIVMTVIGDDVTACDAMKYGAQDFLVKGEFNGHSLVHSIDFAITRYQTLKAAEAIRSEEQQLKEEFLSNVSHELRSPLSAISSFASLLVDEVAGKLNTEQQQYARILLKNAMQLNSMVDDLLEVTRVQAGKLGVEPQCVSLQDAVEDVVESHLPEAGQKRLRLSAEIASDVPPAFADPTRVRQVLDNLVSNALKFTDTGEIRIRLYPCESDAS